MKSRYVNHIRLLNQNCKFSAYHRNVDMLHYLVHKKMIFCCFTCVITVYVNICI